MMGVHQPQVELFSYQVNLEHRIRRDHPLRRVAEVIDFTFVRAEVARFYGKKGNIGIDPIVLLKLMFLLFWDDVPSERELMERLPERLDYLWFIGYGLDDAVPNHSVLSKARSRWGKDVFQQVFVRTVQQCMEAGLIDGGKLHVDSSLIDANASKDSILKGSPELVEAYKQLYQAQETKLADVTNPENVVGVNDTHVCASDPDAAITSRGKGGSRPRYHHHRGIDDAHGVITAVETTPGSIAENKKLVELIDQHEQNTQKPVHTVIGDSKYGTKENLVKCVQRNIAPHLGVVDGKQINQKHRSEIYDESHFTYDSTTDTYRCPAGQTLTKNHYHPRRHSYEYRAPAQTCAQCVLRSKCTRAKRVGRTLKRYESSAELQLGQKIARSEAARRDRRRRQHLMERSFARAANEHGFKRSRWRRLWRQQIQDWLIAAVQNVKTLLRRRRTAEKTPAAGAIMNVFPSVSTFDPLFDSFRFLRIPSLLVAQRGL